MAILGLRMDVKYISDLIIYKYAELHHCARLLLIAVWQMLINTRISTFVYQNFQMMYRKENWIYLAYIYPKLAEMLI